MGGVLRGTWDNHRLDTIFKIEVGDDAHRLVVFRITDKGWVVSVACSRSEQNQVFTRFLLQATVTPRLLAFQCLGTAIDMTIEPLL